MNRGFLLVVAMALAPNAPAVAQLTYAARGEPAAPFAATTSVPADPLGRVPQYEPAPMPDADIYPPVPRVDNPKSAQVTPSLFRPKDQWRGDGYSPGSTVQGSQERGFHPAPGLSMKVPLN